jgi:hypothetical protein
LVGGADRKCRLIHNRDRNNSHSPCKLGMVRLSWAWNWHLGPTHSSFRHSTPDMARYMTKKDRALCSRNSQIREKAKEGCKAKLLKSWIYISGLWSKINSHGVCVYVNRNPLSSFHSDLVPTMPKCFNRIVSHIHFLVGPWRHRHESP